MPDLLLELFSEEIPARMQARAAGDLKRLVTDGLAEAGLFGSGAAAFATPRRLALTVSGLPETTPDQVEERRGPREDAPETALAGFLRATGLPREQLELRDDKKGRVWFARIERPGQQADAVVAEVVAETLRNFPWPKSMRWGSGEMRWVRPLHSVLCILTDDNGARVVPVETGGIPCSDETEGHRFMAPGRFSVTGFEDYAEKLGRAFVMLDGEERARHIEAEAKTRAFAQGLELVEDASLLAEVAGLTEWPVVLVGEIAQEFLDLPPEVLQTSMREHQKFFSLRNPASGRIEGFVTVAGRETADKGATILAGNKKVLSARLADAKFFWENDLRTVKEAGLKGMAKALDNVTFHNKLGSQGERIERIAALAAEFAPLVGANPDLADEAARIAKADLASEMVYEFPELQGVMGKYYARAAGHDDGVPEACEEHYSPLGPSDVVPSSPVSVAVALADKIDMLTGFWAIDEKPTGSKDPFALRRAALGVIRLVLENGVRVGLDAWSELAAKAHPFPSYSKQEEYPEGKSLEQAVAEVTGTDGAWAVARSLRDFFHDRLKVHLREEGIRHDVIDACLDMPNNDDLVLLVNRARALSDFLKSEDGENLLQGFKRANNILSAEERKDGVAYEGTPEARFAEDDSERALFAALDATEAALAPALEAEDFAAAMRALAALRAPIDDFFERVQVNTENQVVRRNRLCLLNRIRAVMQQVARFERIEG